MSIYIPREGGTAEETGLQPAVEDYAAAWQAEGGTSAACVAMGALRDSEVMCQRYVVRVGEDRCVPV